MHPTWNGGIFAFDCLNFLNKNPNPKSKMQRNHYTVQIFQLRREGEINSQVNEKNRKGRDIFKIFYTTARSTLGEVRKKG